MAKDLHVPPGPLWALLALALASCGTNGTAPDDTSLSPREVSLADGPWADLPHQDLILMDRPAAPQPDQRLDIPCDIPPTQADIPPDEAQPMDTALDQSQPTDTALDQRGDRILDQGPPDSPESPREDTMDQGRDVPPQSGDASPPLSACESYGPSRALGSLEDSRVAEASGLAVSRQNPNVVWVHNDSGDGPSLYAVSTDGRSLGRLTLVGAPAVDWEDMALGPCPEEPGDCLYVGDVGDNNRSRTDCSLIVVAEPLVSGNMGEMTTNAYQVVPFSYPDAPHDVETLVVHPEGAVYVVTKEVNGISQVFRFPHLSSGPRVTLQTVTQLRLAIVQGLLATAGCFHPNGRRLLIRTYTTALEYRIEEGQAIDDIWQASPLRLPIANEPQGEAIAYDPLDGTVIHLSEGLHAPLYRMDCAP